MRRPGSHYADPADHRNPQIWDRFDAGVRYTFKVGRKDVPLTVKAENIANKNYGASAHGGYLSLGDPQLRNDRFLMGLLDT